MNCPSCGSTLNGLTTGKFGDKNWASCDKCKVSIRGDEDAKGFLKVWRWTGKVVLWEVGGLKTREECFEVWARRKKLESFE